MVSSLSVVFLGQTLHSQCVSTQGQKWVPAKKAKMLRLPKVLQIFRQPKESCCDDEITNLFY